MSAANRQVRRLWGDHRGGTHRYWARLRGLTALLLCIWLAVTLLVPWFARDLNAWHVAGMPLGLWMASQGAITLYLGLILVYALVSDWLERRLGPAPSDRAWHD